METLESYLSNKLEVPDAKDRIGVGSRISHYVQLSVNNKVYFTGKISFDYVLFIDMVVHRS